MFELIATLVAVYILLAIAFPARFLPAPKEKSKKVGSSYWGVYDGTPKHDLEHAGQVAINRPARKKKIVAGSSMYAGRR